MATKYIQQLYQQIVQKLNQVKTEDSSLVALFIIEFVFSDKYLKLLSKSVQVQYDQYVKIVEITDQFISGVPLAYLLNQVTFRKNIYYIEEGVLIPRPETEEMVDYIIPMINQLLSFDTSLSILELGVGSGIISIELAKTFSNLNFKAFDISKKAIEIATKNKSQLSVTNLTLHYGDFFDHISTLDLSGLTVLVSNPPYISETDYTSLDQYVLKEPKEALVAQNNGLDIIFRSLNFCIQHSIIYIAEIGILQSKDIQGSFPAVNFLNDINGVSRFVVYVPEHFSWSIKFKAFLSQLS